MDCSQPHIRKYIEYEIGTRFKDYRSKLYQYYKKLGDSVQARQHLCKGVTLEEWQFLCNKWESPTWKEKSEKTKSSRSKLPFNHCAGTKSFLSHREEKKREDDTYLSPIDVFHQTHWTVAKA